MLTRIKQVTDRGGRSVLSQVAGLTGGRASSAGSRFADRGRVIGLAHRGDRRNHPPGNTWSAFAAALDAGVEHIESDVHLSADGRLVLFHDDRLDDETTGSGPVSELAWSELRSVRYRLGDSVVDEGLVALGDAIERWPDAKWNLDAKDRSVVRPLFELLADLDCADRLLVTSFDVGTLREIRRLAPPELATGVAAAEVGAIKALSVAGLTPPTLGDAVQVPVEHRGITVVDRGFVDACHRAGMDVHVWTINDVDTMEHLLDLGVDGIVTDDPKSLRSVFDARSNEDRRLDR